MKIFEHIITLLTLFSINSEKCVYIYIYISFVIYYIYLKSHSGFLSDNIHFAPVFLKIMILFF